MFSPPKTPLRIQTKSKPAAAVEGPSEAALTVPSPPFTPATLLQPGAAASSRSSSSSSSSDSSSRDAGQRGTTSRTGESSLTTAGALPAPFTSAAATTPVVSPVTELEAFADAAKLKEVVAALMHTIFLKRQQAMGTLVTPVTITVLDGEVSVPRLPDILDVGADSVPFTTSSSNANMAEEQHGEFRRATAQRDMHWEHLARLVAEQSELVRCQVSVNPRRRFHVVVSFNEPRSANELATVALYLPSSAGGRIPNLPPQPPVEAAPRSPITPARASNATRALRALLGDAWADPVEAPPAAADTNTDTRYPTSGRVFPPREVTRAAEAWYINVTVAEQPRTDEQRVKLQKAVVSTLRTNMQRITDKVAQLPLSRHTSSASSEHVPTANELFDEEIMRQQVEEQEAANAALLATAAEDVEDTRRSS